MPRSGALVLSDAPETVHIVCDVCSRRGRYSRDKLIATYGADISLPDLLHTIAKAAGCIRVNDTAHLHYCRAHFE